MATCSSGSGGCPLNHSELRNKDKWVAVEIAGVVSLMAMYLALGVFDRLGERGGKSDLSDVFGSLGLRDFSEPVFHESRDCSLGQATVKVGQQGVGRVMSVDGLSIVGNVRLDNRSELLGTLGLASANDSCDDSWIVLHTYRKWGDSCVEHLLGDFAFAVFDCARRRLFLARDRVGVYPLYYHVSEKRVVFSSELGAVGAFDAVPDDIDYEWVANTIACVELPDLKGRTFLKSVRLLPNATAISISREQLRERVYWGLNPASEIVYERDSEYVERFRELFIAAVASRLPSEGSVGLELSAGLDSSAIASACSPRGMGCERLRCFSHIAGGVPEAIGVSCSDERALTQRMATGLGLGFVTWIDGAKRKGIDLFSSDWAKFGGIGLESWSMFSTPLYQEASAQGCTVLLSGAGGDELVSAQARGAYFELLLRGEFGYLLRELNSEGVRKEWTAAVRIKRLLASVLGAGAPALASRLGKIPPAQFEHFLDQEVADHYCIMERKREAYARLAYGRLREWQERLLCGSYLSNRRLPQSFARSFVAGVELRYPMLDTRLIEFCFAVPPRVLRNGGLGRALLRGACRELPDYIRFRDNKSVPAIPWVGRYLAEQANALQSIVRTNQPIAPLLDLGLLKQQLDSWGRAKVAEGVLSRRSAVLGLAALLG